LEDSGTKKESDDIILVQRKQAADAERDVNAKETSKLWGHAVQYGMQVQLLHMKSNKWVLWNLTDDPPTL
jgi:hypothetical protein